LAIYDAVRTAKRRLHYFDRYLDSDFFALYLRDLDRAVEVRLVTTAGTNHYGVTNVAAVSTLAAKEFSDYQLVELRPIRFA
jgi:hypothetical protein